MALIKDGAIIADPFTAVADDAPLPAAGAVLVSLKRFQDERDAILQRGDPVGVALPNDQSPEALQGDVARLALIALPFPTFRDGRSYTWARMLRQRLGFSGDLRATGEVLVDQLFFMTRVGFTSFEMAEPIDLPVVKRALATFSRVYQPSVDGRRPVHLQP